jgi:hypothetical protein
VDPAFKAGETSLLQRAQPENPTVVAWQAPANFGALSDKPNIGLDTRAGPNQPSHRVVNMDAKTALDGRCRAIPGATGAHFLKKHAPIKKQEIRDK